ncbi:FUSC family protein [Caballeronia zhejiangensis]|uniref:FUSC family protein n=1 Tax=Caballeronia zhejiangensis TaxID=871203 RepID=UPI001EF6697A|nr:aromatic acid exporter family protein [Caballeronia zhejiangensis]MCG7403294.1 aromatic acid exporter family protein [Caballeronia zhejiangensis]
MCVQSLIASVLTYACMNFIGSSSTTWGVFPSLFALQVSFDRSLKYGVGQMIGAAIGTVVGLATLHFFPDAADAFPRLGLATLVTCLASTLFPTTNYSIVVAAALALEPSAGVAGAVSRAEAIALGAAIGIGVSLSVWPQLSRSRAFEIMGELLDDCRALLATMPILGPLENRERVDALHERFLRHLVEARAVCGETRVRARFETGSSLGAALVAFETLWHGLVLLDRIGQSQCGWLTNEETEPLAERIELVRDCASGYLQALAAWMRGGAPLPPAERFLGPLNDASAAVQSDIANVILGYANDSRQLQALSTLSFALEQIKANLANIAGVLETRFDRSA